MTPTATHQNLTDQGRADARAIGARIRALGIPIGSVRASPFRRTLETAQLAFGRAQKTQTARQPPERGLSDVIVSHGNPFHAVAGPPHLAEGEVG